MQGAFGPHKATKPFKKLFSFDESLTSTNSISNRYFYPMCPAIAGQPPVFHPFSLARFAWGHRVRRERYQSKYFFRFLNYLLKDSFLSLCAQRALRETKAPSSGFQNLYPGNSVEMMVKRVNGGWAFSQSLAR